MRSWRRSFDLDRESDYCTGKSRPLAPLFLSRRRTRNPGLKFSNFLPILPLYCTRLAIATLTHCVRLHDHSCGVLITHLVVVDYLPHPELLVVIESIRTYLRSTYRHRLGFCSRSGSLSFSPWTCIFLVLEVFYKHTATLCLSRSQGTFQIAVYRHESLFFDVHFRLFLGRSFGGKLAQILSLEWQVYTCRGSRHPISGSRCWYWNCTYHRPSYSHSYRATFGWLSCCIAADRASDYL